MGVGNIDTFSSSVSIAFNSKYYFSQSSIVWDNIPIIFHVSEHNEYIKMPHSLLKNKVTVV